ncbi:WD40-repeat-containing domain protein [Powellomyces hirtus]|nr:WD40-repeat-containing domain protein [Powellomyces hirtus]
MTATTDLPYDFRIIVGTYERLLYGIDAIRTTSPDAPPSTALPLSLNPVFIYPAHISCIKAAAATHRFLATGSTDEHIKLYDLRLRKEVGTLMHHSGSITCLVFYKKTHLFTASEDGAISIVRTSDWEVLKTLDGHKRAVNWIDVHPSGKVLLSVGGDQTLKCWDLAKAACTYSMKLPKVAERVCWSPSGDRYAVLMNTTVQIYTIADGELVGTVDGIGRINSVRFCNLANADGVVEEVVITGGEDRAIAVWDATGNRIMRWDSGHANRIKDIDAIVPEDSNPTHTTVIATCSSDGGIKVWDLASVKTHIASNAAATVTPAVTTDATTATTTTTTIRKPKEILSTPPPVTEYNAKCRLTCLVIAPPPAKPTRKQLAQRQALADDKASTLDADAYRSEPESDYEDLIPKPRIEVSFEGDDAEKPVTATVSTPSKKRKAAASETAETPAAADKAKKQKPSGPAKKGKKAKLQKQADKATKGAAKGRGKQAALAKFQSMKK